MWQVARTKSLHVVCFSHSPKLKIKSIKWEFEKRKCLALSPTDLFTTSLNSRLCHTHVSPALLCSSQVQRRCREEEEEERRGDVLASAHCDCELSEGLSLSGRLASGRDYPPTVPKWKKQHAAKLPEPATRSTSQSPVSWPSPCQRSWQQGGSSSRRLSRTPSEAAGRRWRWTSTAPTPHRPSPSTTSTRDASSRHTSTCEYIETDMLKFTHPGDRSLRPVLCLNLNVTNTSCLNLIKGPVYTWY